MLQPSLHLQGKGRARHPTTRRPHRSLHPEPCVFAVYVCEPRNKFSIERLHNASFSLRMLVSGASVSLSFLLSAFSFGSLCNELFSLCLVLVPVS